jgi:hypothetical protein
MKSPAVSTLLATLLLCGACATSQHTRVLVAYTRTEPIAPVVVQAVNATGGELPTPQAGLIARAVRLITRQPAAEPTIPDAFAHAAAAYLTGMNVTAAATDTTPAWQLRITLTQWDVRDRPGTGAVVFVSATYQLLDDQAVLWAAQQDGLPVRLDSPTLGRYEIAHIARRCVDLALESLRRTPGKRAAMPVGPTTARGIAPLTALETIPSTPALF